jgi:ABC-type glycerol-3-phosphate transport system substrate-binding protein
MKRSIGILTLLTILFSMLVGCRFTQTDSQETREPLIITLAGYGVHRQAYQDLGQQFQEQYANIEIQYVSLDERFAHLTAREMAALADVLILDGQPPTNAATAFLNLDPLMTADPTFDATDFWPGIMDACQAAGVQVGLPFRANASLLFFDKAAFNAVGLPYPEPGWSWESFQQVAQALTRREGEQITRYGFLDGGRPLLLLAPLVDNLITQSGYQPDRLVTELDWYVTLANQEVIPAYTDDAIANIRNRDTLISSRQAAMWIGSQNNLDQWRDLLGADLGIAPFPTNDSIVSSNVVSAGCIVISAGTTQSQAAWEWVHFLTRQLPVQPAGQQVAPARPSLAQSSNYWQQMDESTAASIRYALEHGWYSHGAMAEVTAVGEALHQALTGMTSLAEALTDTVATQATPPSAPEPGSTPIAMATPRTTPVAADVVTVEFDVSRVYPRERQAMVALAHAFNESQNNIEVTVYTGGSPFQGPYGSGDMAEIYDCFAWTGSISSLATDRFYSLSPLIATEDTFFQTDFSQAHLEANQIDGELYALPVAIRPLVIQYNVDLFAEAGLDTPAPDWTVDDFWTTAAAAAHDDGNRRIYGFSPGLLFPENLLLLIPEAVPFYDLDSFPPAAIFTDPAVNHSLTWLADMVAAGVLYPIEPLGTRAFMSNIDSRQEEARVIETGQVAMWVEQAGRHDYAFQVGEIPFPPTELMLLSGQVPITISLVISRRTDDPAGCWQWFKFLSSQPGAFPGAPARLSLLESPEWTATVGSESAVAYREMASRPLLIRSQDPTVLAQSRITFPYNFWWEDALRHTFAGSNRRETLEDIQHRADAYLVCITALNVQVPDPEQSMACVREADPGFER